MDDLARSKEVFPVGRLDINTHGLLLLTNDGQLAHVLLSPKRHVDKTYLAQVKGIMTQEDVETFAEGIPLKDFTCKPAILELVSIDTVGTLVLDENLERGEWRRLTKEELEILRANII
ncbi:ribosomal small subunit pseudouridine synthase A [Streptococcus pneumoniae]|nr:ribosomal small subunit pseudouridine synthase A [Streptococcus pneumoniae]